MIEVNVNSNRITAFYMYVFVYCFPSITFMIGCKNNTHELHVRRNGNMTLKYTQPEARIVFHASALPIASCVTFTVCNFFTECLRRDKFKNNNVCVCVCVCARLRQCTISQHQ